mmetsp:Transcript_32327/g.69103  ORF Transcript_32327/g.69103 Transcript_32327/m.69103 type:complete len:90 (-) Transcript_32327:22-291(-)
MLPQKRKKLPTSSIDDEHIFQASTRIPITHYVFHVEAGRLAAVLAFKPGMTTPCSPTQKIAKRLGGPPIRLHWLGGVPIKNQEVLTLTH